MTLILKQAVRPLAFAGVLSLVDSLVILLILGYIPRATLVLVMFLEGGAGLLLGVVIALSSSPSVSKMGEVLMGTSPWSREAENYVTKLGAKWILGSVFLLVIGFLLSAA